jgi:cell division protein ZipA
MDDEDQQSVMQAAQQPQETQQPHDDSQSDPLPVEDDMPDFDNEYIADPEPQPEENDSFAASRDDDMDVLFDDDDRERRIAALEEQAQDSAPKRFMSWVGGAFGRSASASKAQAAEQAEARQDAQDKAAKAEKAEKKARKKLAKAEKKQAQREQEAIQATQRHSDPVNEDVADDFSDDDGILSVRETERPGAAERARAEQLRQSQLDLGDDPVEADDTYAQYDEPRSQELPEYSEVLVINVLARPGTELAGDDLLPVLMSNGLKFGEMSIFHRHTDKIGGRKNGPVMFSVANALNPGTFDLNRISEFSTLGVCFFMTLPNVVNNMMAFEQMLATARKVQVALDAELKDDNRSVMTAQTVEHYRQRIRDFELQELKNAHIR